MVCQKDLKIVSHPFQNYLNDLHDKYQSLTLGHVANYIPELAKVDPNLFSICVVTVDGDVYSAGDCSHLFTIQSISKVFVYGQALQDHGRDYLLTRVGVEPTGDAFNSIVLDEKSKRPYNPMVNAGAIATTSLIKGADVTERLNRLLAMFRGYIGRDVYVDISVFTSERATGHRNRAMAHLMLNLA
ncbi:MAG: glutaminase, partial [Calothrix sp. SM1_7_51]|nr:glutaminase [Calothrix sp. SM1_7_51]